MGVEDGHLVIVAAAKATAAASAEPLKVRLKVVLCLVHLLHPSHNCQCNSVEPVCCALYACASPFGVFLPRGAFGAIGIDVTAIFLILCCCNTAGAAGRAAAARGSEPPLEAGRRRAAGRHPRAAAQWRARRHHSQAHPEGVLLYLPSVLLLCIWARRPRPCAKTAHCNHSIRSILRIVSQEQRA